MATKNLNTIISGIIKSNMRALAILVMLVIALVIAIILYNFSTFKGNAQLSASYASHIICSCRYIQGRDLEDCKKDFEPGMELVALSDDPENKRLNASILFLSEAVAEYRSNFGCIQLSQTEIDAL